MPLEERWNTHFDDVVQQELFGVPIRMHQDPASHNLGTTVWDASIVLAKFLEKGARRGELSRARLTGRRVLELGAGPGLGGIAAALLGADVVLTDLPDIVPLTARNVASNVSAAALKLSEASVQAGSATTAALDWNDPAALEALNPPFDLVLAADCVYAEEAVVPFLFVTKRALLGRKRDGFKAQAVVVNEFRSHAVHDEFMTRAKESFTVKRVPNSRLDPAFEHPLIHVYSLALKKDAEGAAKTPEAKPDQPSPAKAGTSQVPAETEPKTQG